MPYYQGDSRNNSNVKYELVESGSSRWFSLENLLNEEWKYIKDTKKYYMVSNYGRVKTVDRTLLFSDGRKRFYKSRILKYHSRNKNYYCVCLPVNQVVLCKDVHRLVAETFLDNPQKLKEVNHKDRNSHNNRVDNLEWCTRSYNVTYQNVNIENALKRRNNKYSIPVVKLSIDGSILKTYPSIREAARQLGNVKKDCNIVRACQGKTTTAFGYKWKYLK